MYFKAGRPPARHWYGGSTWECNPILDQAGTWIEQKPGDRIPMEAGDRGSGLHNETLSAE